MEKKKKSTEAWKEYNNSRQITKRVISLAKGKKQKECASDLNDPNHQNEIFRIAKQMVKVRFILLCDRRTKQRLVMSRSFQMKCVPKHKLLLWICGLIQRKDGIRSLKQECMYGTSRRKRREEYQSMVKDKIAEAEWKYLDVNEYWQHMKSIMIDQHRSHVDCQNAVQA